MAPRQPASADKAFFRDRTLVDCNRLLTALNNMAFNHLRNIVSTLLDTPPNLKTLNHTFDFSFRIVCCDIMVW
ncbi:hypothetical protein L596_009292 [Steinernema carpocapsae]|uniref:Uncharacterized protein n=1 Tax=Steinernema carpocapsae TaxID=34508 RepID=A0A4U5PFC1_STECR|nr:hypothetical protein L596_009292 [Steinernema carpocapsae]